jgi:hypothetical protein
VIKLLHSPVGPTWLRAASAWPLRRWGSDPEVPGDASLEEVRRGGIGAEFDAFQERLAPALGVAVERSSRYLEWRFLESPHEQAEILTLRRGGLRAFVALAPRDGYVAVKDWLAESPEDLDVLFAGLARQARARRAAWLSVTVLEGHPHLPRLRGLGFFERPETTTAMVYAPEGSRLRATIADRRRWFMTAGDRDV